MRYPQKPSWPSITDETLIPFRALQLQLKTFPDILKRDDCPYSPAVKLFLTALLEGPAAVATEAPAGEMNDEDLDKEIVSLYRELQRSSGQITGVDPKDKAAFLKTMSELLTKMVSLRERQLNVRQMGRFQRTVIEVLETVLEPHQRTKFVELLGQHVDLQD